MLVIHDEEIESLVRQAIRGIAQGDTKEFASMLGELERRGCDHSGMFIIEALLRATERLPAINPIMTADLTKRVADRFEGSLRIRRPEMEAVIRGSNGELEVAKGTPRDLSVTYALVVIGQLVHEGLLSVDQTLGSEDYD